MGFPVSDMGAIEEAADGDEAEADDDDECAAFDAMRFGDGGGALGRLRAGWGLLRGVRAGRLLA